MNFLKYGLLIYGLSYLFKRFKNSASFFPFTKILAYGFLAVSCAIKKITGVIFHHFLLDSIIWKIRGNAAAENDSSVLVE